MARRKDVTRIAYVRKCVSLCVLNRSKTLGVHFEKKVKATDKEMKAIKFFFFYFGVSLFELETG